MTGPTLTLRDYQAHALVPYEDGEPHRYAGPPDSNLVRRGFLDSARSTHGPGFYRLTPRGRLALSEYRRAIQALTTSDAHGKVTSMETIDPYPRDDPDYRYRLVAVVGGAEKPHTLAAAPDAGGLGAAIVQLHEDAREAGQKLYDAGKIGILDAMPDGKPHPTGAWIILPWQRAQ